MKRYKIDVHYDMVIRDIEVVADSEAEARQLAYNKAAQLPMESMECIDKDACIEHREELSAREWHQMQAQAIIDYVHLYCKGLTTYTDYKDERKHNAAELAAIAYCGSGLNWLEGLDLCNEEWQERMFQQISDFEGINANGCCDRYARLYARKAFYHRYKRVAKSPFDADVDGRSKEEKKQAVIDALHTLVSDNYDQVVCRFRDPEHPNRENDYWNLFICRNDSKYRSNDEYEYYYAWQHCYVDEEGDDATDDFNTMYFNTRYKLLHDIFYLPEYDDDPTCDLMTDVWVD